MSAATDWHIEDRKVRAERDAARYTKGLRKTMPRASYYNLTAEQYARAFERGKRLGS